MLGAMLSAVQDFLSFGNCTSHVFRENGIGKIGVASFWLGIVGGLHIGLLLFSLFLSQFDDIVALLPFNVHSLIQWSAYMSLLCLFHFLEFFITALYQPNNLSYESLIINHSEAYTMAATASWVEYWLEMWLFGGAYWKLNTYFCGIGLLLLVLGQVVRTVAMATCGEYFAHIIMTKKSNSHRLITHGIYSVLRHPSYFGWFYWSIGTQILLCNPLCIAMYSYSAWMFFKNRIPYEERLLVEFYGQEYVTYMSRTVIGIPFVEPFKVPGHQTHTSSPTVSYTRVPTSE
jgi:protein-S-isoprenylcysteine O-methyltransferase